jgi:hypothetical protein
VSIRNLLRNPEIDYPLNQRIAQQFWCERANYDRNAREVADREGASVSDWPYTNVRKYEVDDNESGAGENDDTLESQLLITRTKPTPITIDTNDLDIYD